MEVVRQFLATTPSPPGEEPHYSRSGPSYREEEILLPMLAVESRTGQRVAA